MGELTSLLGVHSLKYKMPHWRRCLSVQSNTAHNCFAPFMWAAVTGAIAYKPAMPGAYVVTMPTILWAHGSTCTGEAFFRVIGRNVCLARACLVGQRPFQPRWMPMPSSVENPRS